MILDIGKQRLVFFTRELFVTGSKEFLSQAAADANTDFSRKILVDRDSIFAELTTLLKFDSTQNAILINSLTARTQDGMLFVIEAYINPDFSNRKGAAAQGIIL